MNPYRVKLSFEDTPITIHAESIHHARQIALADYRDQHGNRGKVEWVGKISPQLTQMRG